jgi:uncharacterized protein YecE (DUF72 family)
VPVQRPSDPLRLRIGTAGWSIPAEAKPHFKGEGSHLERYARTLNCAEINSSFHRSHREAVYRRWAEQTPADFRFAVKLPRSITHEGRLRRAREPLRQFLSEVAGLGPKLGPLLVQLPPSFDFEARPVRSFFQLLADMHAGTVVCEPRHLSWFSASADRVLAALKVSRAGADPARCPQAAHPGGWLGPAGDGRGAVLYWRWHGSPRKYWSRYDEAWIHDRAAALRHWPAEAQCWCIFDNTAGSGAVPNALQLRAQMA